MNKVSEATALADSESVPVWDDLDATFNDPNETVATPVVFDMVVERQAEEYGDLTEPCAEAKELLDQWAADLGRDVLPDWNAAVARREKAKPRLAATSPHIESVFDRIKRKRNPYLQDKYKQDFIRESLRIPEEFRRQATEALAAVAPIETIPHHNQGTLAMALACAAFGIPVVDSHALDFRGQPTGADGDCKNPRGAGWGDEASTDPSKIIERWTGDGRYPVNKHGEQYDYADITRIRNVSAATGDGFFIWDVDGDDGAKSHADFIAKHGELPPSPVTISGSGGRHYYFRSNRTIHNTTKKVAPGIDVRGVGGQGLLPLSMHKSGNIYVWAEGCAPWEL